MAIDILSKLNTGGSGLDLVSLSTDLAAATYAPKQALVSARIDRAEVSTTALGRVAAQMESLSDTLALAKGIDTTRLSSSQANVAVTLTDATLAPRTPIEVEVLALAQSQVLEFTGFSGPDAVLGGGTLTIDIGAWTGEPPQFTADPARTGATLAVPAGASLQDLAEALSALPGVTARAIAVGDGTWSLGVVSETGANNSLRFTAAPDASADIAALDFSADPTVVERRMATNALLTLDGIPVGRPDNRVDDLVPGMVLDLTGVTTGPATIRNEPDSDTALGVMQGVVEELNALKSLLRQVTARGTNGSDAGDLAGDPALQGLARELDAMLTGGLPGYGARPVMLAELGLRTERDGSLTLDTEVFENAFAADPATFRSVLQDNLASTGPGVTLQGMPALAAASGRYDFRRDPATGAALLGDIALSGQELEDGRTTYDVTEGPLRGLSLTVEPGVTATSIDVGRSLASRLSDWVGAATSGDGAIGRRQDQLADSITRDGEMLETLKGSASAYEARMRARFAEMEQVITQLNSTGDYIQNLIDSFNAEA